MRFGSIVWGPLALVLATSLVLTAQPVAVEPGWTLTRTIGFQNPQAAHFNPIDGRLYVGRRGTTSDGLYRIDPWGFAEKLAAANDVAALVVDPVTGDVFVSEDYGGAIFRTAFGTTGRQTWVSGFHAGDDDPIGMAVAPAGYIGDVLAPGEALVVDRGYSGLDEIWAWSPLTPEGERVIHADAGILIEAVDIAISDAHVYLVDEGGSANGVVYELRAGGALAPVSTSEPLASPVGIAFDPASDDLFILDAGGDRVVRLDPASGLVSDVLAGFGNLSIVSWAGIDPSPEGRQLFVTDLASQAVFVFARCDAAGWPAGDCNGNGTWDACELDLGDSPDCNRNRVPDECDLATGTSADCNADGVPDECPMCPPLEVVFVMDTSTSMDGEAAALCASMNAVAAQLASAGVDVAPTFLGISDNPGGAYACLTDNVINLLGSAVPGSPPPGLEMLGACPGGVEVASEDWGLATAVVAGLYPWTPGALHLVVPLADEGPWCGDPVTQIDHDAIAHAARVAQDGRVIVSPITGTGSSSAVVALAQQLADATGGVHTSSTAPDQDLAGAIIALVLRACTAVTDCNENGVLDECESIGLGDYDVDGDTDFDDYVGFASCMAGPDRTAWHPVEACIPACVTAFDFNADVDVDLADFAALQALLTAP